MTTSADKQLADLRALLDRGMRQSVADLEAHRVSPEVEAKLKAQVAAYRKKHGQYLVDPRIDTGLATALGIAGDADV